MNITYKELPEEKIAEIHFNGSITKDELPPVLEKLNNFIEQQGKIKLMEVVNEVDKVEPDMLLEGLKFDWNNLKNISHVAVVTDQDWADPLSKMIEKFSDTEVETFPHEKKENALKWLQAANVQAAQ